MRRLDLASAQIASNGTARRINRDILLELIRYRQPISRVGLARHSGLRPSTVSEIVEQLLKEGWIREGALVRGPRGRPSVMLTINDAILTFALDIRPDRTIIAVVDLAGRFLLRENIITLADPKTSMARIVQRLSEIRLMYPHNRFEGIGVSVPGRVHPVTQELLLAPNLHWIGFDIKKALETGLGLQAEIDNDANACMLSECWSGRLANVQHAVLVAVSEGIGAAILAGGQLHAGFNGLAGEFGHIQFDKDGPECGCGQRGCWEMFASSRAAVRNYQELSGSEAPLDVYAILRLAENGDATAHEAVARQATALGRGLRLIMSTLSPELILITGEITSAWSRFGPIIQAELEKSTLAGTAPRLATAGDGDSARLHGATAVLLHSHAGYLHSYHHMN
ncbi:MAG: ROK family transcriptional regulator [Janthinobacterium lividum]